MTRRVETVKAYKEAKAEHERSVERVRVAEQEFKAARAYERQANDEMIACQESAWQDFIAEVGA